MYLKKMFWKNVKISIADIQEKITQVREFK